MTAIRLVQTSAGCPEQALVLANRLTRAASLILESEEQPPDIEREAARFAAHDQDAPEGER